MTRSETRSHFSCKKCGKCIRVSLKGQPSLYCQKCLYSLLSSDGKRENENTCKGQMRPAGLIFTGKKGWEIINSCAACGKKSVNPKCSSPLDTDCNSIPQIPANTSPCTTAMGIL